MSFPGDGDAHLLPDGIHRREGRDAVPRWSQRRERLPRIDAPSRLRRLEVQGGVPHGGLVVAQPLALAAANRCAVARDRDPTAYRCWRVEAVREEANRWAFQPVPRMPHRRFGSWGVGRTSPGEAGRKGAHVRRRSPVGRAFLGSVAQTLILECDVPVLVVKRAV